MTDLKTANKRKIGLSYSIKTIISLTLFGLTNLAFTEEKTMYRQ
jgi:hypothetical protein